ncbi:MAG: hypothetical protein COV10_04890 [Candidatus Vogelbacteria bacterium CG10_big_fil_rev_8_21_14_0_10_51_16]|uniref:Uncharacterized protein n=1 Tax=Candidatus Vogelbacteria bacterium CG10_big_fil_rev_8_21_14_0_10_51_16 TaxID=1975045 RepID=A0A2H0RDJ4_9BACT|nr:MAG: hypothetical protein COV10_04890 [Candidatus Vogelbacteria bacterium CG10_big_fil_rev_8_21_14_0_10_51_16]
MNTRLNLKIIIWSLFVIVLPWLVDGADSIGNEILPSQAPTPLVVLFIIIGFILGVVGFVIYLGYIPFMISAGARKKYRFLVTSSETEDSTSRPFFAFWKWLTVSIFVFLTPLLQYALAVGGFGALVQTTTFGLITAALVSFPFAVGYKLSHYFISLPKIGRDDKVD